MAADLTGPRLKVQRAEKHHRDLAEAIKRYLESHPYKVVTKDNPEAGRRDLIFRVGEEIPASLSLLSGDVVHNLRSALDHLMWQLVHANGGEPSYKTEFPVGRSETHFEAIRARKTEGISESALDVLNSLKPYKGGSEAFWRIHQLDVVDKHRLMLTVAATSADLIIDAGAVLRDILPSDATFDAPKIRIPGAEATILRDGDVISSAPLEGDTHDHMQFSGHVSFAEPGVVEGESLVPALAELGRFTQGVIESFAALR
jgi:hypothetical protein